MKIIWRIFTLTVDDMGKRLDELESSIGELMTQAGIEEDLSKTAIKDATGADDAGDS